MGRPSHPIRAASAAKANLVHEPGQAVTEAHLHDLAVVHRTTVQIPASNDLPREGHRIGITGEQINIIRAAAQQWQP
jgi:hypothetical protein